MALVENVINIEVNTDGIDAAIEKANTLVARLKEANALLIENEKTSLLRKERVFLLGGTEHETEDIKQTIQKQVELLMDCEDPVLADIYIKRINALMVVESAYKEEKSLYTSSEFVPEDSEGLHTRWAKGGPK